jgi:ribosomal protein S4
VECDQRGFSDDTLAYFTERLDASAMRAALAATLQQAKRNKAFENSGSSAWL